MVKRRKKDSHGNSPFKDSDVNEGPLKSLSPPPQKPLTAISNCAPSSEFTLAPGNTLPVSGWRNLKFDSHNLADFGQQVSGISYLTTSDLCL